MLLLTAPASSTSLAGLLENILLIATPLGLENHSSRENPCVLVGSSPGRPSHCMV